MEVNVIFFLASIASLYSSLLCVVFSRQLEVFELARSTRLEIENKADDQQNWKLYREMIQKIPFDGGVNWILFFETSLISLKGELTIIFFVRFVAFSLGKRWWFRFLCCSNIQVFLCKKFFEGRWEEKNC